MNTDEDVVVLAQGEATNPRGGSLEVFQLLSFIY